MTTTTLTTPIAAAGWAPAAPLADERALAERIPTWALFALAAVGTLITGPRWGVAAAAWLAPVPYLVLSRRLSSWRGWLTLFALLAVAFPAQLLGIVTPPVPTVFVAIGLGTSFAVFGILALTEWIRRRAGETIGLYAFAAMVAAADAACYRLTKLGTWGGLATTQADVLPLLQLTSLVGMAGVAFLVAWFAGTVASLVAAPVPRRRLRHGVAVLAALTAGLVFGSIRLDGGSPPAITVGAVTTDLGPGPDGMPDDAALNANTDLLFERTRIAAARGARVVVWNEVATLIDPAEEVAFIARARNEARTLKVDLMVAYGILLSREPLRFDNKYAFITDAGDIAQTYRKHHPPPGEPSIPGTGPLSIIERPYGRVGGAICYDYDFPAIGLEHARLGADIVFVPSSDWRGIDPVHTLMARGRAVESGFSMVRATRWGPSAAFDALGRVRGWMPATEDNDRVMIAGVPIGRTPTLYGTIGDAPAVAAGAFVLVALALAWRRRRVGL